MRIIEVSRAFYVDLLRSIPFEYQHAALNYDVVPGKPAIVFWTHGNTLDPYGMVPLAFVPVDEDTKSVPRRSIPEAPIASMAT